MSRSRKKVGGHVDRCPYMKNYANRRLRSYARDKLRPQYVQATVVDELCDYVEALGAWTSTPFTYFPAHDSFYNPNIELSYSLYKRYSCPWDICDWKWLVWSRQEAIKDYERYGGDWRGRTLEQHIARQFGK